MFEFIMTVALKMWQNSLATFHNNFPVLEGKGSCGWRNSWSGSDVVGAVIVIIIIIVSFNGVSLESSDGCGLVLLDFFLF